MRKSGPHRLLPASNDQCQGRTGQTISDAPVSRFSQVGQLEDRLALNPRARRQAGIVLIAAAAERTGRRLPDSRERERLLRGSWATPPANYCGTSRARLTSTTCHSQALEESQQPWRPSVAAGIERRPASSRNVARTGSRSLKSPERPAAPSQVERECEARARGCLAPAEIERIRSVHLRAPDLLDPVCRAVVRTCSLTKIREGLLSGRWVVLRQLRSGCRGRPFRGARPRLRTRAWSTLASSRIAIESLRRGTALALRPKR